jgi:integrase
MSKRPDPHIKGGTFAKVISEYMQSPHFNSLAESSRYKYRRLFKIAEAPEALGLVAVEQMHPAIVQAFLDGFADRPGAQYGALAAIKAVEKWAIVRRKLPGTITLGCELIGGGDGNRPWTEEQVYFAEHRLPETWSRVVTLMVNTGQRGSDIVKMGWTDLETYDGHRGINVIQKKTGRQIWIPCTAELNAAIDRWERAGERGPRPFILKARGTKWTREDLSTYWTPLRNKHPELAGCKLHGLRAVACVRLLRAGANTRQIGDMVGMSEQMVARYTRFAEQRKNALAAVAILEERNVATGMNGERTSRERSMRKT